MVLTRHGLSLEEFLALPEEKPALEYLNGVVTQKVAPLGEHSALQLECAEYLNRLLRPRKIARAFTELRSTYGGASLVPDVSVYRCERIPRTANGRIASRFLTAPDLAVEVWSPGQAMRELAAKCEWLVGHGVLVALLVDHRRETIRVFRPNAPVSVQRAGDRIGLDERAPGVELVVDDIFAALRVD